MVQSAVARLTHSGRRWTSIAGLVCLLGLAYSLDARAGSDDATLEVLFKFPPRTIPPLTAATAESAGLIRTGDGSIYGTTPDGGAFGAGTIFRIDAEGRFELRHSFAAGTTPIGGLVESDDGRLHGLLSTGESASSVVAFTLDSTGAVNTRHVFDTYPGGGRPVSGLTAGSDGFLYGVTAGAGAAGSAFRLDDDRPAVVLHALVSNGVEGSQPVGRLVEAFDGNFYGVTSAGGAHNAGVIFRMTPDGELAVVHSFNPETEGRNPAGGVSVGPDGELYGALCTSSKSFSGGNIYRVALTGALSVIHELSGTEGSCPGGELSPSGGAPLGGAGSLVGITRSGGAHGSGTLYQINLRGTVAVLHAFGEDLSAPVSAIHGSDGAVYGMTAATAGSPGVVFRLRTRR